MTKHDSKTEQPKLIRNWEELAALPPSETHEILVDTGHSGWLKSLGTKNKNRPTYLSTHTFYGRQHKVSTAILQRAGFNVEIANWDELDD